jgi:hypothetical protein
MAAALCLLGALATAVACMLNTFSAAPAIHGIPASRLGAMLLHNTAFGSILLLASSREWYVSRREWVMASEVLSARVMLLLAQERLLPAGSAAGRGGLLLGRVAIQFVRGALGFPLMQQLRFVPALWVSALDGAGLAWYVKSRVGSWEAGAAWGLGSFVVAALLHVLLEARTRRAFLAEAASRRRALKLE